MASFNRADYEEVYSFARKVFYLSANEELEKTSTLIMMRCEDVIGQQSNFPAEAREVAKVIQDRGKPR